MIPRHAQQYLETLLAHFPCVVVTGVRQCGKTTLLSSLPGEWRRFDMENGSDRQQILADPDLFLRLHPNRTIIDEAQLAPTLFPALRVAIDRERAVKGRFLLSGSSSPELVKQISETLAGRIANMELGPLSLSEAWELPPSPIYPLITTTATAQELLEAAEPRLSIRQVWQCWLTGGYPEPWLSGEPLFQRFWTSRFR